MGFSTGGGAVSGGAPRPRSGAPGTIGGPGGGYGGGSGGGIGGTGGGGGMPGASGGGAGISGGSIGGAGANYSGSQTYGRTPRPPGHGYTPTYGQGLGRYGTGPGGRSSGAAPQAPANPVGAAGGQLGSPAVRSPEYLGPPQQEGSSTGSRDGAAPPQYGEGGGPAGGFQGGPTQVPDQQGSYGVPVGPGGGIPTQYGGGGPAGGAQAGPTPVGNPFSNPRNAQNEATGQAVMNRFRQGGFQDPLAPNNYGMQQMRRAGLNDQQMADAYYQYAGGNGYQPFLHGADSAAGDQVRQNVGFYDPNAATLGSDPSTQAGYLRGGYLTKYNQAHGTRYGAFDRIPGAQAWLQSQQGGQGTAGRPK